MVDSFSVENLIFGIIAEQQFLDATLLRDVSLGTEYSLPPSLTGSKLIQRIEENEAVEG